MVRTISLTAWLAAVTARPSAITQEPVEIADYRQSRYHRRLTLTPRAEQYDLLFSIEPTITPYQFQRMSGNKRYKFFQDLGVIQHVDAIREFGILAYTMNEIVHGREWQSAAFCRPSDPGRHPYAPRGPWHYLAPEHQEDWRTRANAILPRNDAIPRALLAMNLYRSTLVYPPSSIDALVTEGRDHIRVRATYHQLYPQSTEPGA